ncbi:MAG: restriction endonuclease subunit S [Gammaproteobacteria bacterium]|nr:restriction endonuclease subunit S [Gammaproteobacteria bacterium]
MSFPAYPQYKNSGIETLGEIPNHWDVTRLPYVVFDNNAGEVIDKNFWGSGSELLYTCAKQPLLSDYKDFPVRKRTGENDLLLTRNGTPYVHLPIRGSIYSNVVQRVSLIPSMDRNFMRAALDVATRDLVGYGVSIASFNYEMWTALRIPLPVCEEQTQIARFLDHETARIDALIDEQQRLIELLKEKRQALISHAVTKGLDPTVPMKDSGVEWLGEVPAHWDVRKLKNLVSVRGGSTPSKEVERYWEGDIPWVSPKDMKSERISNSIDHVSASAIEDGGLNMVKSGAILIVVRGMILIHSVPVAITDVEVTINQDMKAMTPGAELSGDYLSLLLQGVRDAVFQYIDSSAHGTRKLEWERFELIDLPIPSHEEQVSIVSFIEKQKRAIDNLVEQAASAITLMKERRSALISAAVTGKIDVRAWQPPVSVQAPELAQEAV